MSLKNEALEALVRPIPRARYECDVTLWEMENYLARCARDYELDLVPDFQRGHVWNVHQQTYFIESMIRGAISVAGLTIQFNCPDFGNREDEGDIPPMSMLCIDGLQRLTAVRKFMSGDIKPFGLTRSDLADTQFSMERSLFRLRFAIHAFTRRTDLLQYYLDINSGGTPHSQAEIDRVKDILEATKAGVKPPKP